MLVLPALAQASDIDCEHVRVNRKSFDLSALAGPHSLSHIEHQPPSIANTTYTLDICAPLKMPKKTPKGDKCPNSTRVCAIKRVSNKADHTDVIEKVIPVAGNFDHGRPIDANVTRLKTEESEDGTKGNREGLRLELHGGQYPIGKSGRKQMAVIELICPKGEEKDDDEARRRVLARESGEDDEDDEDGDKPDEDISDTPGLKFISYGPGVKNDKDFDILKLEWLTKHACEGRTDLDGADPSKSHWGFFTWFIIMLVIPSCTSLGPALTIVTQTAPS